MKIHAVIPARRGSKRFKNKNKYPFYNQQLFLWSVNSALNSKILNDVIVSTDDREIINTCIQKKIKFLKRPKKISGDKSKSKDVLVHYLKSLIASEIPDYIVLLQPTSPLREKDLIDNAIKKIIKSNADNLIEVCPLQIFYGNVKDNYWVSKIPHGTRKQDLPPIYIPSGRIFIYKTKNLIKNRPFKKSLAVIQSLKNNVNIDLVSDLHKLNDIYIQNKRKYSYLLK